MKPIHCFGDSHLEVLTQSRPDIFIGHGTTSLTAYKVGKQITDHFFTRFLLSIPNYSRVLLSFGEIDCSLHIIKFARKLNKSFEEVTAVNIAQYRNILECLQKKYKLAALGPYPYLRYPNTETDTPKTHIGTFDEVLEVKWIFNRQLKTLCDELNVFFLTVFDETVKNKWYDFPDSGYYRDPAHLGEFVVPLILEKLKDF